MIMMIKGNNHLHNERGGKSLRRLASVLQKMVNIANDDDDGVGYDKGSPQMIFLEKLGILCQPGRPSPNVGTPKTKNQRNDIFFAF